jgi:hypothetical protein
MLCREYDGDNSLWVAELVSDTEHFLVYQSTKEKSWQNLKKFLADSPEYSLRKIGIRFRSHYEWLPGDRPAYYFGNAVLAGLGMGPSKEYRILGYEENGKMVCRWYCIPELIQTKEEIREVDASSPNMIRNGSSRV